MSLEFYNFIKKHSENSPNHPAIIDGKTTITYGQLLEQAECFAGGLTNLKLNAQSKLGLLCLNQKEYLVALMGAFLKGLTVVPYNFLLTPEDMIYITNDATIDTVIVDSVFIKPETIPFIQSFKNKILVGDIDSLSLSGDILTY